MSALSHFLVIAFFAATVRIPNNSLVLRFVEIECTSPNRNSSQFKWDFFPVVLFQFLNGSFAKRLLLKGKPKTNGSDVLTENHISSSSWGALDDVMTEQG